MSVRLDHTIVAARDKQVSAEFLAEILGLPAPVRMGPFVAVRLDNGVALDFADSGDDVRPQHYAFAISDAEFDEAFGRIQARGLATGPIPPGRGPVRSASTTAAVASTSRTRAATSSRS